MCGFKRLTIGFIWTKFFFPIATIRNGRQYQLRAAKLRACSSQASDTSHDSDPSPQAPGLVARVVVNQAVNKFAGPLLSKSVGARAKAARLGDTELTGSPAQRLGGQGPDFACSLSASHSDGRASRSRCVNCGLGWRCKCTRRPPTPRRRLRISDWVWSSALASALPGASGRTRCMMVYFAAAAALPSRIERV